MNDDFPKNEIEFDRRFSIEESCLDYLFQLRWPEGFCCSRCGHQEYWHASRGHYLCRQCKHQQSLTARTIFHATKKPLQLWFKAMWLFSTSQSSVNATALKDRLGLGSYQTAWSWLQKLRTCTVFSDRSTARQPGHNGCLDRRQHPPEKWVRPPGYQPDQGGGQIKWSARLPPSLFRRVMIGIFQGRFDPQYLQRYLDEYAFRFNRRTCKSIGKLFWRIAQQSVSSAPITWTGLRLNLDTSGAL